MKKKLVWRLDDRPTVDSLKTAVEADLITKEEAKDMLVRSKEEITKDSLKEIKDEIKFLRDMVLELSRKEPEVVYKHIYDYWRDRPYKAWGSEWYSLSSKTAESVGDNVTYAAMNTMINDNNN